MSNTSEHPSELILYNYFRSSTSYRIRCALNIKKLKFTYKAIHLTKDGGQQNQKDYREINPMGGVPTLVHRERTIAQSYAIVQYLEDEFSDLPSLFPKKSYEKALVNQFCQIINADLHSYANLKTLQYLEKKFSVDEATRLEWIHSWFENGFKSLEIFSLKYGGQFSFGDSLSAADCFLVPLVFTANRFKMDTSKFTRITEITNRLNKISEFMAAHPFRQPDTPEELKLT
jgi:maleylacetoacetate isomerase